MTIREIKKMINWNVEAEPIWDSTGTIKQSWYAQVGKFSIAIDEFTDGSYAYWVMEIISPYGSPEGITYAEHATNEPAESFDIAEQKICEILAKYM